MEAKETMLALREALLAVKEENFELREAYSKLRQEANTRVSMHYEEPVYYFLASDGSRTGPFCQTCFDREGKSSRLQSLADGYWYCSVCKAKPETVAHAKLRSERIAAKRSARRSGGLRAAAGCELARAQPGAAGSGTEAGAGGSACDIATGGGAAGGGAAASKAGCSSNGASNNITAPDRHSAWRCQGTARTGN